MAISQAMQPIQRVIKQTLQEPYRSALALALLLLAAGFLRFYQIGEVPPGLFPDEATHALDALRVLNGSLTIYSPAEGSTGALWRYLLALNFSIFGHSILALRAFASAIGVLSVVMAYLVIRELSPSPPVPGIGSGAQAQRQAGWRESIAFLAALLLATSYWHVDLSRTAFSAVLMLLIQDASFFFLWRALNSGRRLWFILFGAGMGLQAYNYLPGKLAPAVPLVFFALEWLISQRDALLVKFWRPLLTAFGTACVIALPFVLFAVFNYDVLWARASMPMPGPLAPISPLQGVLANLEAFGLWPTYWLSGQWQGLYLGPVLTLFFLIGVVACLASARRPAYLFLLVWWLIMLLPGALAPEGAVPHIRRSIGMATATFALASLGVATAVSILAWMARQLWLRAGGGAGQRASIGALVLCFGLGLVLVAQSGASTFRRYFLEWGPSEAAKLVFHVYDLELAEMMEQSGPETVYLLPLDSAAGTINPLLDSITFAYQGEASYDFLPDDEREMPNRLAKLTAGKQIVRLLRWKVTKHTGADPKGVAHYYLEKWGRRDSTESRAYFEIETYELSAGQADFAPTALKATDISFEGQIALTGYAFGNAGGFPVNVPTATAGDLLWAEIAWRKSADSAADYQVALRVEDEAGHVVGRVDKPLLNNLWHQGTGRWPVGAVERDYYLVPIDLATMPGTYRLKAVVYAADDEARRLAPALPGIGADLAVTLGDVEVRPPPVPPDVTTLTIPQHLNLEVGDGLRLLGFDPGFAGALRPGDRATLSLWWHAVKPPAHGMDVVIGIGQGEQAWRLGGPQPLGGADHHLQEWPAEMIVRTFLDLRVPPDVEAGRYNLGLRLQDRESGMVLADWLLGQVEVAGRARTFGAPAISYPLEADFGGQIRLLGYDLDVSRVGEGGPARLTLYWQAQAEMDTAYKVFVHLLNGLGQIITQVDREPQAGEAPTTGWLAGEVVVDDIEVAAVEGMAGTQSIAVGLYDPMTGQRLPVLGPDGAVLDDGIQVPLP